ncbi:unnamed protein product [Closterium sp. Naga37s-1]|nr:unnamed protein product [Closterium sp. Naga37s-1]
MPWLTAVVASPLVAHPCIANLLATHPLPTCPLSSPSPHFPLASPPNPSTHFCTGSSFLPPIHLPSPPAISCPNLYPCISRLHFLPLPDTSIPCMINRKPFIPSIFLDSSRFNSTSSWSVFNRSYPLSAAIPRIVHQAVIAEINAAIGAKGVLSEACKQLVHDYAVIIIDLLEQKVRVRRCKLRGQASASKACKQLVHDYAVIIINLLEKKMDPNLVCHAIGLCDDMAATTAHTTPTPSMSRRLLGWQEDPVIQMPDHADVADAAGDKASSSSNGGRVGDPKCSLCEATVIWVQNQLARNKTHAQIINHLNKVCFLVDTIPFSQ